MTCVKTGSTISSALTTTASPSALTMSEVCGLTSGHSHARRPGAVGVWSNAVV